MQTRFKIQYLFLLTITLFCTVAFLASNTFFSSLFSTTEHPETEIHSVIIIGGGIGGQTAALNLALNGLKPLILEGPTPGGLLTLSHSVRNWPGIQNTTGEDLVQNIRENAKKAGALTKHLNAGKVDCSRWPYLVTTSPDTDGKTTTYKTTSILIASGTTPRMLGIPGETGPDGYWGKGVSNCAVCDGGLYKNKVVALIGGGQAAIEEAEYLASLAKHVFMIVRKSHINSHEASKINALLSNKKITVLFNTIPSEIIGDGSSVTSLKITTFTQHEDGSTIPSESSLNVSGIFEAIGSLPNSSIFKKIVDCNDQGYIRVNADGSTNHPGIFAVGDVTPTHYRQAIMVSGHAAQAAPAITLYVKKTGHHETQKIICPKPIQTRAILPPTPHTLIGIDYKSHPDVLPAIIVGAGAAGLTAAIYLGYAGYSPLVFEGKKPGGSVAQTLTMNRWPNKEKTSGAQLAKNLKEHALAAGALIKSNEIASISHVGPKIYKVTTTPDAQGKTQTFKTFSIIIATGNPEDYPRKKTKIEYLLKFLKTNKETGHILTSMDYETSVPGIYAIGNAINTIHDEPIIGAGQGAEAALNVCGLLRAIGYEQKTSLEKTKGSTMLNQTETKIKPTDVPHLTTIQELQAAIKAGENVMIDCFATWCPPCKALKPVLQKIYGTNKFPDVHIYAVDVDEAEELSAHLRIQSLPTLVFFAGGKEISRTSGFNGESWLSNLIQNTF